MKALSLIPDRNKLTWYRSAAVCGEDPIGGHPYSLTLILIDRLCIKK
jgi:hypothetical protein